MSMIEQFSIRNDIDTICYYSVMKKVTRIRLVEISDPMEVKRAIEELYRLPDFDSWDERNDGKFRYVLSLYSEYLKTFGVSVAEETSLTSVGNDSASEDMNTVADIVTVDEDSATRLIENAVEFSSSKNTILDLHVELLDESIEERKSENVNAELREEIPLAELSCCAQMVMENDSTNNSLVSSIPDVEENRSDKALLERSNTINEDEQ